MTGNTLRVLVVDDNRSLVEGLADVFEAKGYEVETAFDGEEAVERVRNAHFDCVLMDIRMPKLSGVDAFKQIKQLSPGTPVILMTAYSVQGLIDEAREEGAVAVLHKPLVIDKLLQMIERLRGESSILVVDPQPNLELVATLSGRGYRVATATDTASAVAMVSTGHFDIVLLNAEIQGLTSDDSVALFNRYDPKCIIILLSSETEAKVHPLVYASLHKPFKIRQVVELLDRVRRTPPL